MVGNESVTRKVFWQDPYLTELDTKIARVAGDEVTVEETILYALSGGQESDCGAIGGRRVLGAEWRGREIVYSLESGHGLTPGEAVRIDLDWRRRYRLMRLHFAAELVLEVANRRLSRPEKIGAHIAEDKARIDFVWRGSIAPCRRRSPPTCGPLLRPTGRSKALSATRRTSDVSGASKGSARRLAAARTCIAREKSAVSR